MSYMVSDLAIDNIMDKQMLAIAFQAAARLLNPEEEVGGAWGLLPRDSSTKSTSLATSLSSFPLATSILEAHD